MWCCEHENPWKRKYRKEEKNLFTAEPSWNNDTHLAISSASIIRVRWHKGRQFLTNRKPSTCLSLTRGTIIQKYPPKAALDFLNSRTTMSLDYTGKYKELPVRQSFLNPQGLWRPQCFSSQQGTIIVHNFLPHKPRESRASLRLSFN